MDWMAEPPYGEYVDINAPKLLAGKDAEACKVLAEHGNTPTVIAMMLKVDEGDVKLTLGLKVEDGAKPAGARPAIRPIPAAAPARATPCQARIT